MKVSDQDDGQWRVGYTPTADNDAVDRLHRLGVLARNIIVGDRDRAIDHVAEHGVLVVLDRDDLHVGPEDRVDVMKLLRKKSVMAQVGERGLDWKQDAFTHAAA